MKNNKWESFLVYFLGAVFGLMFLGLIYANLDLCLNQGFFWCNFI